MSAGESDVIVDRLSTIKVPVEEWLEYILSKHAPKVFDIGDQRDPLPVIGCICMPYGKVRAGGWDQNMLYSKHLVSILEPSYFTKVIANRNDDGR